MTIYDQDTDPSTPGARNPPGSRATSTDPGVGPPVQAADGKPTGVVVPPVQPRTAEHGPVPVFATARKKDSVELLLDGMAGPRPDRVKTMPRTAGDASAAYHAEHAVHAAHTSPDEQPKVVVERGATSETGNATPRSGKARPLAEIPEGWRAADPTYVPPSPVGPRVLVALLAAITVVVGLFVSMQRPPQTDDAPPSPPAAALVQRTPSPPVPPAAPATLDAATRSADLAAQVPSASASGPPLGAVIIQPQGHSTKSRRRPTTPPSDLGEFKTTF